MDRMAHRTQESPYPTASLSQEDTTQERQMEGGPAASPPAEGHTALSGVDEGHPGALRSTLVDVRVWSEGPLPILG